MPRTTSVRTLPRKMEGFIWKRASTYASEHGVSLKSLGPHQIEKITGFHEMYECAHEAYAECPAINPEQHERGVYDARVDHRKTMKDATDALDRLLAHHFRSHGKKPVGAPSGENKDVATSSNKDQPTPQAVLEEIFSPVLTASVQSEYAADQFEHDVTDAIDAATAVVVSWREEYVATRPEGAADATARNDAVERVVAILNDREAALATLTPSLHGRDLARAKKSLETLRTMVAGHVLAIKEKPLHTDVESWEDLADETPEPKNIPASAVRKELLGNVELITPHRSGS